MIIIVFWTFELKNPGDIQVESLNSWVWMLEERFLEVVIYILFFYKLLTLLLSTLFNGIIILPIAQATNSFFPKRPTYELHWIPEFVWNYVPHFGYEWICALAWDREPYIFMELSKGVLPISHPSIHTRKIKNHRVIIFISCLYI